MINARDIYNIQNDLEHIKSLISGNEIDFLTSEWGILNNNELQNKEVSFLKGRDTDILNYLGKEGQVIYNLDTKKLHLLDGKTLGGTVLGEGNGYINTKVVDIVNDNWTVSNDLYETNITHNLNSNIENLDIKFFIENKNVLLSYIIIDNNTFKVFSNKTSNIKVIVKSFNNSSSSKKNIITEINKWVLENGLYKYSIKHDLNISIDELDIKFYKDKRNYLLEYIYIDKNNINIFSDVNEEIQIVIRKET